MVTPRSPSDDGEPFEDRAFLSDEVSEAADVEFGGGSRRSGDRRSPAVSLRQLRRRWWLLAGLAVGFVIVFVVVANDGSPQHPATSPTLSPSMSVSAPNPGEPTAAPATSPPTASERTAAEPTATEPTATEPPATAPPPTPPASIGPVLANGHDWGLFFVNRDGLADPAVTRLDLATGAVTHPGGSFVAPQLGLTGSGPTAAVMRVTDISGLGFQTAAAPDGNLWIAATQEGTFTDLQMLRVNPGSAPTVLASYPVNALGSTAFVGLAGSTADGTPILTAPDGSTFVVDPQAETALRFSTSRVVGRIDHGDFGSVQCDQRAQCDLALHGVGGATATVPYTNKPSFLISPDGTHALIGGAGDRTTVTLLNLVTGAATAVGSAGSFQSSPFDSNVCWTPDGASALVLDGTQLIEIDARSAALTRIALPAGLDANLAIVGIA